MVYTDGGCSGNPGPGGWAFVVLADGVTRAERSGGERDTTNNRMELLAVISALESLPGLGFTAGACPVTVVTDSEYVRKGMSEWILKWKANGWRTASKAPVKNAELWRRLDALAAPWAVRWRWVRGHAGQPQNERCDALVQEAIRAGGAANAPR